VADVKLSILYHLTRGTGIEANNGLYPLLLVSKTILFVTAAASRSDCLQLADLFQQLPSIRRDVKMLITLLVLTALLSGAESTFSIDSWAC
jgi:hypothetical protein